jgi:hypothetical protein
MLGPRLAALAAALVAASAAAGAPRNVSFQRMKKMVVVDHRSFERPMPALTMLLPPDWKLEGDVTYPPGMPCGELLQLTFRAQSPDGKLSFELFPAHVWEWADDPSSRQFIEMGYQQGRQFGRAGCGLMPPMRAADFITRVLAPRLRPGARVLGVGPMPGADEPLQAQIRQTLAQAQQLGIRMALSGDTARAKLAYQASGAPVEEWLIAVATVRATPVPALVGGQLGQTLTYVEEVRLLFGMRAPAGQLEANEKLFTLIASTLRLDPEWEGRVTQVQLNIASMNQKGVADRARIQQQAADDIRRIQDETYQNRQRSQDRTALRIDQYIRGVETYRDPGTGERVELSNQYGRAWSNGAGEYVLSDSPGFSPSQHLNGSWTQLEQVPAQ